MERNRSLEKDEDDRYDEFFGEDSGEKRQKTGGGGLRRLSDKNSRQKSLVNITYEFRICIYLHMYVCVIF